MSRLWADLVIVLGGRWSEVLINDDIITRDSSFSPWQLIVKSRIRANFLNDNKPTVLFVNSTTALMRGGSLAVKTATINICNSSQLLRLHRQDLTSYISRTRTSERSSKTRTTWRPCCCTSRATPRSTTWWVAQSEDVNQPRIILMDWCKQSHQKLSVIVLVFNPSQIWSWNCPQLQASRVWELLSVSVCLSVFVEKL